MKKIILSGILSLLLTAGYGQAFLEKSTKATNWVDSVFKQLSPSEKVAQLMIVRAHSNLGAEHITQVEKLIKEYNIGGLCFFQGGPVRQALLTNKYQQMAKTPLMICIDGEWGLGMRLDSVINFPRQLMMGAVPNAQVVYEFGKAVGLQCKRLGIQVNYAPDIDINNNPNNPVINDRSFGEDKYKVALFGKAYMQGMQDVGVMACAKHFPGHGDVAVDSHYDLPVINKSLAQLDSLELYPFKVLFNAGVGSVMVAHLYIPAIDSTANLATSLSRNNVTNLMRNQLGYKGLSFTDALEMQGVAKFFPAGEAAVQSLIAGNDMLCLPGDVAKSIDKVLQAVADGKLNATELDDKVKKALLAKYNLGLHTLSIIDTANITADINNTTLEIRKQLSEQAIAAIRLQNKKLLQLDATKPVAYVSVGVNKDNHFAQLIEANYSATMLKIDLKDSAGVMKQLKKLKKKYQIVVGMHNYSRRPANNFGLSNMQVKALTYLAEKRNVIFFAFGNPYAIKNIADAKNIIACFEDDTLTHKAAYDILQGVKAPVGSLPVTVSPALLFGSKVDFTVIENEKLSNKLAYKIDAIMQEAINGKATPGAVVYVAKKGQVIFEKAYGYLSYDSLAAVSKNSVYDLASVTKISATTMAIMKLYEQGKINLNSTISHYLPETKTTNKGSILVKDILLHQAGLVAWIPFYRETIDTISGKPNPIIYQSTYSNDYNVQVANNLYMRNDWKDTMYQRILNSKVALGNKYVYSDNDFIFLGKIVERITGTSLDKYVQDNFYKPLGMYTTTFLPNNNLPINTIAPTEIEKMFRQQLLHGFVHDPGAAMFGGVAGHAGLFSNASDLAKLYQMLLNGGTYNGTKYFSDSTIQLFTNYQSSISRRGLGFDKPEKDNATKKEPYPAKYVSSKTFGHTGFTGTCVWADPANDLIYIFLSNRVHSSGGDNNQLGKMNIRSRIQDAIYTTIAK